MAEKVFKMTAEGKAQLEAELDSLPTLYSIYTSIYNKRERPVFYYLCPTGKLAIFSSKDNILNA